MTQLPNGMCPVCQNAHAARAQTRSIDFGYAIECSTCGRYDITREAYEDHLEGARAIRVWTPVRRAALSHRIRNHRDLPLDNGERFPKLKRDVFEKFEAEGIQLPLPPEQARNLIRILGSLERESGGYVDSRMEGLYARIGASNPKAVTKLAMDLQSSGLAEVTPASPGEFSAARLTLAGWEQWETMVAGKSATGRGFLAMQFGDARLDEFVSRTITGAVQQILATPILRVDSPESVRAGIIDNIMREAIQDASFVLVELSHGNKGAYWEAGYAEGLGKPVVYICEKAAWEDPARKPHFDVNHHTTVMWSEGEEASFVSQLVATIRNSLARKQ